MAKRPSLNPLRLISESWRFLLKQPALWHVLFWFMIMPAIGMDLLQEYNPQSDVPSIDRIGDMGYILATILFLFVTFWGVACVQVVGRRMIQSKAGRARTSFRAVRRDAVPLIVPLFFTDLLRSLITFEWALLYIIPTGLFLMGWTECREVFPGILQLFFTEGGGIPALQLLPTHCFAFIYLLPLLIPACVYMLRTILFDVAIGAEGLKYRQALNRSKEVMRGRFWRSILSAIGAAVILIIPAVILAMFCSYLQQMALPQLPVVGTLGMDVVTRFFMLLYALSMISLFGRLRKLSTSHREVRPRDI
jgi:hypothetical protein